MVPSAVFQEAVPRPLVAGAFQMVLVVDGTIALVDVPELLRSSVPVTAVLFATNEIWPARSCGWTLDDLALPTQERYAAKLPVVEPATDCCHTCPMAPPVKVSFSTIRADGGLVETE